MAWLLQINAQQSHKFRRFNYLRQRSASKNIYEYFLIIFDK